ncbi:hypothetical protein LCGC14_0909370 [marine sediment metagenome]|uniref:Uncharacterized protein n=1 Tax=marine sediment metagenome TaxID=412755 RepID=A0A0F9NU55_9ZZZZ
MTNSVNHVIRAAAHNRHEPPDYSFGQAYPLVQSLVSSGVLDVVRPVVWTRVSREALMVQQPLLRAFPFGGTWRD